MLGHEWAGTIAAVGSAVTHWAVGERVVLDPTPGCGRCRACLRGRPSVCLQREPPDLLDFSRGAFCRYKAVAAARLLRIPESLSTRAAALTEPTAIALHSVNLADVTPDDRVLVTGGGPVGLLTTAVLRSRGVRDIVVSEPAVGRRERALAVGATTVGRARRVVAGADGPPGRDAVHDRLRMLGPRRRRGVGPRSTRLRGNVRIRRNR